MTDPRWWDCTFSKACGWTREKVIEMAEPLCKRFVVGDEIGAGGYEHLQARFEFKTGKELATVQNQFYRVDCDPELKKYAGHWTVTHTKNFDYVEKEGNYYRSWEKCISKWANIKLRPWQEQAEYELIAQGDRCVSVIVDVKGNHGKSWLGKYLEANHKADYCPVNSGEAKDYVAYCLQYKARAYVFDIPRADTIKDKKQMWKAIESIKNGCLYDGRYSPRKEWIDPPAILVFANEEPPYECMSADRWRVWTIDDSWGEGQLMPIPEGEI